MVTVVSVKFKGRGKTYYFDPNGLEVAAGDQVVVETSKGLELCTCVQGNHVVTDERIVPPLRCVVRLATKDDLRIAQLCKTREREAFAICEQKIAAHGLDMKLVDVECAFDGNKILFFFTSDGRVDFRELVKDLAGVFRTRIELRQIGVRDEAKMLGGIGMCGRPFCCNQFLDEFHPVSTKMAKVQNLSLNPTKISGCCGRLMCCLRYEQEAYESLVKSAPKLGAFVETTEGYGNVTQVNLLRQQVKVRLDGGDENNQHSYPVDEIAVIPGGRPRPGEPLPHILEIKVKPKLPEPEERDYWLAPPIFAEDTMEGEERRNGDEGDRQSSRNRNRRRGNRGGKNGAGASAEQPAKPQAPEKPAQPAIQLRQEEGANKKNRSHRRGGNGGKGVGEQPQPRQGGQEKKPQPRPQEKKPQPKPGLTQSVNGEGQAKKSNPHRRYRGKGGNKPKGEGQG